MRVLNKKSDYESLAVKTLLAAFRVSSSTVEHATSAKGEKYNNIKTFVAGNARNNTTVDDALAEIYYK
jgi:hypothetical protein